MFVTHTHATHAHTYTLKKPCEIYDSKQFISSSLKRHYLVTRDIVYDTDHVYLVSKHHDTIISFSSHCASNTLDMKEKYTTYRTVS